MHTGSWERSAGNSVGTGNSRWGMTGKRKGKDSVNRVISHKHIKKRGVLDPSLKKG